MDDRLAKRKIMNGCAAVRGQKRYLRDNPVQTAPAPSEAGEGTRYNKRVPETVREEKKHINACLCSSFRPFVLSVGDLT